MTDRALFLDTAASIGRRLAGQAVWADGACTWRVHVRHRSAPASQAPDLYPAGSGVYGGTAGLAIFLAELHRLAPNPLVRRTAEGAVAHALRTPGPTRTRHGFFDGRVGAAYAAARAGLVFERDDLLRAAADALENLMDGMPEDAGTDVISGEAGAIPVLLQLARMLDRDAILQTAAAMGERVMAAAEVEPGGWAWGEAMQPLNSRRLCGLAHGASGAGHALLELWYATGDARFRYGAEQAFAYERQFFDADEGNWRDLRHNSVSRLLNEAPPEELRVRWMANDPGLAYEPHFVSGWCHGAPGIALTRLRAHALTGRAVFRDEAEAALRSTRRAVEEGLETLNHSLCHGLSGNAAILLHAARALDRPELREAAERVGAAGAESFERAGVPWRCGGAEGISDPGLMLGEAGIGYFHLMLADDAVPDLLLPVAPPPRAPARPGSRETARERRMADAAAYFGRTLRILRDAGEPAHRILLPLDEDRGTVVGMMDVLRDRMAAERDPHVRARLEDAFRLEARRYSTTVMIGDFLHDYLRTTLRTDPPPVEWDAARFQLSEYASLVECAWDWDADADTAPARSTTYLLHQDRNRVRIRKVSPLAALVLREVAREPAGLEAITAGVAKAADLDPDAELAARVRDQLQSLHLGGVVEWSRAPGRA